MSVSEPRPRPRRGRRGRGRGAPPRVSYEELEIRACDGAILRAVVQDPPDGSPFLGTVVLVHTMLGDKSAFGTREHPGLSSELASCGLRTVAFDFRGHGDSRGADPGDASFSYDDLVRRDLPAVYECARARDEGQPVVMLGHSIGGTVALAAQGTNRTHADAIVAVGANVWLRELEPSRLRWAIKSSLARAALTVSRTAHRLALEGAPPFFVGDVLRGVMEGVWRSADGKDDYLSALSRITAPVATVLGERDRLLCHPAAGDAFADRCAGQRSSFSAPVGHRALVKDERARPALVAAVRWALAQARP
jgi:alpha-beta hydrolase superfamily lysophospholipase